MARRPSSVCLSVNFCANRFFSQTNGRIATKLAHDGLRVSVHQGVLKFQVKVKGHVIRALSWIFGMSYSVIDGLFFSCKSANFWAVNMQVFKTQLEYLRSSSVKK